MIAVTSRCVAVAHLVHREHVLLFERYDLGRRYSNRVVAELVLGFRMIGRPQRTTQVFTVSRFVVVSQRYANDKHLPFRSSLEITISVVVGEIEHRSSVRAVAVAGV